MEIRVGTSVLQLVEGDITDQDTDAIVNAASRSLLGDGGVDGAIHHAGGPAILEECRELHGCDTGDAKITGAGYLHTDYVIHAVGPVYYGGRSREVELLASAYLRSLEVALEHGVRSIAFPSISTGAYYYPVHEAADIALRTVIDFLHEHPELELVRFVLFDTATFEAYIEVLQSIMRLH